MRLPLWRRYVQVRISLNSLFTSARAIDAAIAGVQVPITDVYVTTFCYSNGVVAHSHTDRELI